MDIPTLNTGIVFFFYDGTDLGGFTLGPDGFHPIGQPYPADVVASLRAAAALASPRLAIKDVAVRKKALTMANEIVAPHLDEILRAIPVAAKV